MGYSNHYISRVVSCIHALVVSSIAIYILLTRNIDILWDPKLNSDSLCYLMLTISSYYLFVDFIIMILYPSPGDTTWWVHHIVGGLGLYYIRETECVWFVGIMFELTELSTIFLNICWGLLKLDKYVLLFNIFSIFLAITFYGTRWVGGVIMWYYIYDNYSIIKTFTPLIYYTLFTTAPTIFILNLYWGYKLGRKFLGLP